MVASRLAAVVAALVVAGPAMAQELNAQQAQRLVVGKLFSYSCFEGTKGTGRVQADGSVNGSIQMRGKGPMRYAALPTGTLQVRGEKMCASLRGVPFEPCFNLRQTGDRSFRGSVSGFGYAYCDFIRRGRADVMRTVSRERIPRMTLRSSITQ